MPLCVSPTLDLVSWWPGDGNVDDLQGGNNGTLQGGTSFAPGKVGQAFNFPVNTNAHVSVGNPSNLHLTGDLTITAWIKPASSVGVDHIFTRRPAGCTAIADYQILLSSGELAATSGFNGTSSPGVPSGLIVPSNQFSFVAVVFHNAVAPRTVDFYVNDLSSLSVPALGTIGLVVDADVQIGQANDCSAGTHFDGLIDEVTISDRALTAEEIQDLFIVGRRGICKP